MYNKGVMYFDHLLSSGWLLEWCPEVTKQFKWSESDLSDCVVPLGSPRVS